MTELIWKGFYSEVKTRTKPITFDTIISNSKQHQQHEEASENAVP